jgi:hypothetical protein
MWRRKAEVKNLERMIKKTKKPQQKEEKMQRSGWLLGWKEIADYMGCSVKTAQGYQKKYKLPIQILPNGIYDKFGAVPSDLDNWLRKQRRG